MIVWKPVQGHNIEGDPIFQEPWDFEHNPELVLQRILAMPPGKPVSLEMACALFWEKGFELWDVAEPTSQSMEPHSQHLRLGIVGYAQSLGLQIVLRGTEYEIPSN